MASAAGRRIYNSNRWRVVRQVVFKRDGHQCVFCGRHGRLECDHIRPIVKEGDWFALDNLRTVCRGCHIKITAEANAERRNPRRPPSSDARRMLREMALQGRNDAAPQ